MRQVFSGVTVVILLSLTGCEAQRNRSEESIQRQLEAELAATTVTPPAGADPDSKAAKTYLYWRKASIAMKLWNKEKRDWEQWPPMKRHLENLPTQGVDEDAVNAVLTMSKAITEAFNETKKTLGKSAVEGTGQPLGKGIVIGAVNGLATNEVIRGILENADAEVTRLRGILSARYNLGFPSFAAD